MVEVQNQLRPLIEEINRQGKTIRSLYANGSGGPPGYLEMARAEDKEVQGRLFSKIEDIVDRLGPLENFVSNHQIIDKDRDRRVKRYIAYWSLGAAIFLALIALYDHRDAIAHSLLTTPPSAHSQLEMQDATIPANP